MTIVISTAEWSWWPFIITGLVCWVVLGILGAILDPGPATPKPAPPPDPEQLRRDFLDKEKMW